MTSIDYHTECIPYHTSKKHLFVELHDMPNHKDKDYYSCTCGWEFTKMEDYELQFEPFINTLYNFYKDDVFALLDSCESGTLSAEDLETLTKTLERIGEHKNIITKSYIAKEDHLNTSIDMMKTQLIENNSRFPDKLFDADKVVRFYNYFKYGEYYFFWYGTDTFERMPDSEICTILNADKKIHFMYLRGDSPRIKNWFYTTSYTAQPTFDTFVYTLHQYYDCKTDEVLTRCVNGTLPQDEIDTIIDWFTDLGTFYAQMYISKEDHFDECIERAKPYMIAATRLPCFNKLVVHDVLQHHVYFKFGEYYFFWLDI